MLNEQKTSLPNKGLEQDFAHYARVLGHPARITILLEMIKAGGTIDGKIVHVEGMSPTTVIQHLRELKRAGVIDGRIFGARSNYWICNDALVNFKRLSLELFFRLETLA